MHQHVGGEGAGEEGVVVAAGLPPVWSAAWIPVWNRDSPESGQMRSGLVHSRLRSLQGRGYAPALLPSPVMPTRRGMHSGIRLLARRVATVLPGHGFPSSQAPPICAADLDMAWWECRLGGRCSTSTHA